jgi:hypothetical protein
MFRNRRFPFLAMSLTGLIACFCVTSQAYAADSGQRVYAQQSVEPATDNVTGGTVYIKTPIKAPFPSNANPRATAPLYLVLYPLTSTVPAYSLNCQPNNCDHVNVLPFASTDYGALLGTDKRCMDFNGGNPCSPVEGHDHLIGVANTGGDFNVAWHVELVVFTHSAFLNKKINNRVTTVEQINALVASKDAIIIDTPVTFNCSITSERTYELGTPVVIPFP